MIIGNGDIASAIDDRKGIVFFASGVSNSKCEDEAYFIREKILLLAQPKNKHLVYFSSLGTFYNPNTPYMIHKKKMEALIKEKFMCYTIFKLGNIIWGDNPNTIINFFKAKIKNKEDFEVRDELRYLITKDQFRSALINNVHIGEKEVVPVTGRTMKISQIVDEILQGKL